MILGRDVCISSVIEDESLVLFQAEELQNGFLFWGFLDAASSCRGAVLALTVNILRMVMVVSTVVVVHVAGVVVIVVVIVMRVVIMMMVMLVAWDGSVGVRLLSLLGLLLFLADVFEDIKSWCPTQINKSLKKTKKDDV